MWEDVVTRRESWLRYVEERIGLLKSRMTVLRRLRTKVLVGVDLLLRSQPDFFVIGAMKSGTTSLFQYLNFRSRIESSAVKEPCYYSYNFSRGRHWYLAQFPRGKPFARRRLFFDASAVYLHDPQTPPRLYSDYPQAKLIVVLRDPIERAVSHYNYYSNADSNFAKNPENRIEARSIEQAFRDDMAGTERDIFRQYCRASRYGGRIRDFLNYYKREQLMFLDIAELEGECSDALYKIADFIGLPEKEQFRSIPVIGDKVKSTESFARSRGVGFRKYNSMDYHIPVSEELSSDLISFFSEDVRLLLSLSGREFFWSSKYTA